MLCNSVMQPALILVGTLVAALALQRGRARTAPMELAV